MEETLFLDSIFEITNTVASCWMNTFDGFWLDSHLNLSDSIKKSPTSTGRIFVATYQFAKFLVPIVASSS